MCTSAAENSRFVAIPASLLRSQRSLQLKSSKALQSVIPYVVTSKLFGGGGCRYSTCECTASNSVETRQFGARVAEPFRQ